VRRLPLIAVALVGALPGPGAQAAWTEPQSVSSTANEVSAGTLAIDPGGRALLTWSPMQYRSGQFAADGGRSATRPAGASAFDQQRGAPVFVAGPVLFAGTRTVGLDERTGAWERCGGPSTYNHSTQAVTLRARFGRSTGAFEHPVTIASYRGPGGDGDPAVAANAAGQVLAAWSQSSSGCARSLIEVSQRRPGASAFSAPTVLRARGDGRAPSVAVGQGGDMLVAWARQNGEGRTTIEARYRPAGGSWGPVQALGTGSNNGYPLTTAVTQNGRAYVAWGRQTFNADTGVRASLYVAVRPAGARIFRASTLLERVNLRPLSYVSLKPVLAVAGNAALIAWTGHDTTWAVRVAAAGPSGGFGRAKTVSSPATGALLGGLALLPGGTAAIAWSTLDAEELPADVTAAVRPAGGSFMAPEHVSAATRSLPQIALSPATLQPTVAWTQNFGPASTSAAKLDVRLRAASRVAP